MGITPKNGSGSAIDSEVDMLNILKLFWQRRWQIGLIPIITAVITAGLTLLLPNIYRSEVLLAPVSLEETSDVSLGSLGGLASLAGISLPSGGDTDENLAVLKSRKFVWSFVQKNDLMALLFADDWDAGKQAWKEEREDKWPTLWDAYRLIINDVLRVADDKQTGLVTVSMEWKSPILASQWANNIVDQLNEYLRARAIERSERNLAYLNEELAGIQIAEMRQTLYQLIAKEQRTAMLANTQVEFAFKKLDPAVIADRKVRPRRSLIVLFAWLLSGLLVVIYVLYLNIVASARHSA